MAKSLISPGVKTFLKKLEDSSNLKWRLGPGNKITLNDHDTLGWTCPLVAVADGKGCAWWRIFEKLGLTHDEARLIADAADIQFSNSRVQMEIRKRMLAITGLEGE